MNKRIILLLVAVVFISSFLAGSWLYEQDYSVQQPDKINMQYLPCDPVVNTCQAILQSVPVSILFLQPPTALQVFEIEVRTNKLDIKDVSIDFRMPSMNMGINFYRLDKVSDGIWKGKVILPVCTSRRSDWIAELQINHKEKLWVAEFAFTQSMDN